MSQPRRRPAPSARDEVQPLPGCLAWPIRVLAVIFVVPVKLAWDALVWIARMLWKYVGAPLVTYVIQPVLYYAIWLPFYYVIWVPLRWITVNILWVPLVWLAEHVIAPVCVALWKALVWFVRALGPFWRALGRVLLEVAKAVGWALTQVYRYILTPIGKAIAFVWRWVVVPVAMAVAWAWKHSVVLLWRYLVVIPVTWAWRYLVVVPVAWAWRHLVVPPARWVHTWVLRPVADASRRVLATLGLR
ncbi:hypothetical protein [Dactylosporangium sp. CA-233914]|uniref:hypothetical protein n=1 Tax=Dactylosporangium sp. CA-233914 TaxID=3239934 RepID=UPI003D941011